MSKPDRSPKDTGADRTRPEGADSEADAEIGTEVEADDEADAEGAARRAGEEKLKRRNQTIQDKSLGAPVTGMAGTPKPARR